MKARFWRVFCMAMLLGAVLRASSDQRLFSVGLHALDALTGNYGLTISVRLASHVELSVPLEYYSFKYSLPGRITLKSADKLADKNGVEKVPKLSMSHLKGGVGLRLFFAPSALDSGFYVQPVVYGGWIRSTDFAKVEFDNRHEALRAVAKTVYSDLPVSDYFALTPQLNIGYQWISDLGILVQLAAFGSYVYAPRVISIFDASQRFFSSRVVPAGTKSQLPSSAIELFRAFATQMPGWHAGVMLNLGFAI